MKCNRLGELQQDIATYINEYEKWIDQMEKYISRSLSGSLLINVKNNKAYYTRQYKDANGKWAQEYLSHNKTDIACNLAQANYYRGILSSMRHNLDVLRQTDKRLDYDKINEIYDSMSRERRRLINPYSLGCLTLREEWQEEENEPFRDYPEALIYKSEQGEMVRSKSELIIANYLYRENENLLYRYEQSLTLNNNGEQVVIHPDFTILNLNTGHIKYWEHAGRMDDAKYANKFVAKERLYINNDLIPGKDVIFTYETYQQPLDINTVNKMIESLMS